jgi:hypothetical protein
MIIEKYGEPDETTESMLIWHHNKPWKRTIVHKEPVEHKFPKPHTDIVEQAVDYKVPVEKFSDLAKFDGSVKVDRTKGEMSAKCHDEEANFLALNLAHDIIQEKMTVDEARTAYAQSMIDFRMGQPAPYMEGLKFKPMQDAADPDETMIRQDLLDEAEKAAS